MWASALRSLERAPTANDEASLIADASRGDQRAFDVLYRRHAQRVYARLTRLIGPSSEREDLMQQIFFHLYRALPSFRGEAPFGAFVHGITVRVGYDHLRRRTREKSKPLCSEDVAELVAEGSSPEAAASERQQLLVIFSRLDEIKPKKRVAFVLHAVEGLSLEEMSRMLDTDARTLGQRVAYARRELRALLERDERRAREKGSR
jgi:RNA polymerase sigma-70 factor (ECF subfamily)